MVYSSFKVYEVKPLYCTEWFPSECFLIDEIACKEHFKAAAGKGGVISNYFISSCVVYSIYMPQIM